MYVLIRNCEFGWYN